jgi:hypothetical protein
MCLWSCKDVGWLLGVVCDVCVNLFGAFVSRLTLTGFGGAIIDHIRCEWPRGYATVQSSMCCGAVRMLVSWSVGSVMYMHVNLFGVCVSRLTLTGFGGGIIDHGRCERRQGRSTSQSMCLWSCKDVTRMLVGCSVWSVMSV